MLINDEGSIVQFCPEGDLEYEWLEANVEAEGWQWLGRTLCVDARMAGGLVEVVQSGGWEIGGSYVEAHRRD
mgnify:CR=1 FL=1